jgi:hypothetical protein
MSIAPSFFLWRVVKLDGTTGTRKENRERWLAMPAVDKPDVGRLDRTKPPSVITSLSDVQMHLLHGYSSCSVYIK